MRERERGKSKFFNLCFLKRERERDRQGEGEGNGGLLNNLLYCNLCTKNEKKIVCVNRA